MGEMADDYAIYSDLAQDFMSSQWDEQLDHIGMDPDGSRKQTARWTTASGERIRICDMTDEHLTNTVYFLERRAKQLVRKFMKLVTPRGEMAGRLFDDLIEELASPRAWIDELPVIYWKMKEDAARRGLQL